jgi:hypothetical protein
VDPRRTPRAAAPAARTAPKRDASPAGRRPAAGGPGLQDDIDRLGRDIQQLRIDFERFFSGALPFPPDELRARVLAQLRGLRNTNLATAVDTFRLGDMEARFNSYNELYSRRVREREEGRQRSLPPPPAAEGPPRYDPRRGILVGVADPAKPADEGAGPALDPAAVEALYNGLAAGPGEGPRFDLASFGSYLRRQAAAIAGKTGCSAVQFRLAEEEGKLKLKARPIASPQGAT